MDSPSFFGHAYNGSELYDSGDHFVVLLLALAIVAIIFAAQVNGKVAAGDMQGAMDASKNAKLFSYISIGVGLGLGPDLRYSDWRLASV
jgi:hypothetical protein